MTVLVERRAAATPEQGAEAGALLQRHVKESIGVSIAVEVAEPGTVERSAGKMRRTIDKRPAR
jgi:phenylacetate-CoA ligase